MFHLVLVPQGLVPSGRIQSHIPFAKHPTTSKTIKSIQSQSKACKTSETIKTVKKSKFCSKHQELQRRFSQGHGCGCGHGHQRSRCHPHGRGHVRGWKNLLCCRYEVTPYFTPYFCYFFYRYIRYFFQFHIVNWTLILLFEKSIQGGTELEKIELRSWFLRPIPI